MTALPKPTTPMHTADISHLSPAEKAALLKQMLQQKAAQQDTASGLSYGQQAIWFMQQAAPDSASYNTGFALRVASAIEPPVLRRALQKLHNRHAVLTATYHLQGNELVQQAQGYQEVFFEEVAADGWPEEQLHAEVVRCYHLPFGLGKGPVSRTYLFRRGPADWVLLFSVHHIAYDDWSARILLEELLALYQAEQRGVAANLPAAADYFRFVQYQAETLRGESGDKAWAYWQQALAEAPEELPLPLDYPRPNHYAAGGDSVSFVLDATLARQLRPFSRQEGVTMFTTLLAAFQLLLHRYASRRDIVLGIPAAGRNHADFRQTVGYFVNLVPVRSRLEGTPGFRDFLKTTYGQLTQGLAHQDFPFGLLVDRLRVAREGNRHPLFQVTFSYIDARNLDAALAPAGATQPAWQISPYPVPSQEDAFDITLELREDQEGVQGSFKFKRDLFRRDTLVRMKDHYQDLLGQLLARPDAYPGTLPFVTAAEARQIAEWNATATPFPVDQTIGALFEAQAALRPGAEALYFEGTSLAYEALNRQANQLARYLREEAGLQPGQLVGLLAGRSPRMIVGLLGILKAGGAYLPIPPESPADRVRYLLEDAAVTLLLHDRPLPGGALPGNLRTVDYPEAEGRIAAKSPENLQLHNAPGDLLYVMYTSGSTGNPKGVMVTHRNVVRLVRDTNYTALAPGDRVLQLSNYAFDGSTFDIFGALLNGAALYLVPQEVLLSDLALATYIRSHRINVTFCTTALFNNLVEIQPECIGCFDKLYFGGEQVSVPHVRKALTYRKHPEAIVHVYGPTECTTFSTYYPIGEVPEDAATIPIGRPLANGTVYILDEARNPVPPGVSGEIYIGGAGVAAGYLNRPGLTAEKFIPDPSATGQRLYVTGDYGKWQPDGNVCFLGRKDHQVKIRGFRVELGEIESALFRHPAVKEAAVLYRQPGKLVAFVAAKTEGLTAADLRGFLAQTLPAYMVPAHFTVSEALPLNANGKIDRKALAGRAVSPAGEAGAYAPPQTPAEAKIAGWWQEMLQVERVGLHDNFFELGGHSLLAAKILARVRSELGADIPVSVLFGQPTVGALAAAVAATQKDAHAVQPIQRASREQYKRR